MDKEFIKQKFKEYVSGYNVADIKIALKIAHTYRVADISEKIAISIGLPEEDVMEAWTIGMLHDIARFEQIKKYNTFLDSKSVDHAEFGVKLLFEEGLIDSFLIRKDWYDEIRKAIRNHNKYRLPDDLTERELVFCKIIRDADKIDIIRVNYETPMEEIYNTTREALETEKITDEVYEAFFNNSAINHSIKRSSIDSLVGHVSLCFELEYEISREILKQQGYLNHVLEFRSKNEETAARIEKIKEYILEYLG